MTDAHVVSALTLSPDEFASLAKIGGGPPQSSRVPAEHLMKLVGLRYIEATAGSYKATVRGRFRLASGS
jgi:hypothetical protein